MPNHTGFVHEEEFTDFVQGPETDSHTISRYFGSTEGNDGIPTNSTGQGCLPRSLGDRITQISILIYSQTLKIKIRAVNENF